MNIINRLILTISLLLSVNALAAIAVIVHPENDNVINAKQIRSMYLAKNNSFPNGDKVSPLDVTNDTEMKNKFAKVLLRKSPSSLNSYWSRMIFSAKGKPPKVLSMSAVKAKVAIDHSAIGYIDSESVDDSVKVIYLIE